MVVSRRLTCLPKLHVNNLAVSAPTPTELPTNTVVAKSIYLRTFHNPRLLYRQQRLQVGPRPSDNEELILPTSTQQPL